MCVSMWGINILYTFRESKVKTITHCIVHVCAPFFTFQSHFNHVCLALDEFIKAANACSNVGDGDGGHSDLVSISA